MDFLVRASGDSLYLPVRKCEVGRNHYGFVNLPKIRISPNRFKFNTPLLPLLEELLEQCEGFSDVGNRSTTRINLLFENYGDYDIMDIEEVARMPVFDFFVRYSTNADDVARFRQADKDISFNGKVLDHKFLIQNLSASLESHPEKRLLDLIYLGSSGVGIPSSREKLSEISAYGRLVRAEKKKFRIDMREKLMGRLQNKGIIDNLNTLCKRIVLSLTDGYISEEILLRKLQEDDYECGCILERPEKQQLVAGTLQGLVKKGILNLETENGVNRRYKIAPDLLKPKTNKRDSTGSFETGEGFLFTDSRVA